MNTLEMAWPRRALVGGWFKIYDHATNSYANNLAACIEGECALTGADRFNAECR